MKKISLYIKIITVTLLSVLILSPAVVGASNKDAVCEGVGIVAGDGTTCEPPTGTTSLNNVIAKGLNLFSAIIGVIAVVMIMIAGIKYITSEGDSAKTAAAKNTVLYAAVGLVIAALAQIIVRFVLRKFTF